MACDDFVSVARDQYVRIAAELFALPGRRVSVSRLSVMTGIDRKEVRRIMETVGDTDVVQSNRASCVISDLLWTVEHNTDPSISRTLPQLFIAYDDVPEQGVQRIQTHSERKSRKILQRFDKLLASQNRSVNTAVNVPGRYRTGVGSIFFWSLLTDSEAIISGDLHADSP